MQRFQVNAQLNRGFIENIIGTSPYPLFPCDYFSVAVLELLS